MVNTCKLKARIVEMGLTQTEIAKRLNIAQTTLSCKINNSRSMTMDEAEKLQRELNISDIDFASYFFYRAV